MDIKQKFVKNPLFTSVPPRGFSGGGTEVNTYKSSINSLCS